ncbi:hypothetical protein ACLQ24_00565 [Micromonospora sp. DT4]
MDAEGEQAGRGGLPFTHGDAGPSQQRGIVGEATEPGGVPLAYGRQV